MGLEDDREGVILARVIRDGVVESVHRGHIAVCNADGELVASLGDPQRLTYLRSAVKPFQALAVLEVLDAHDFALDDDGLAIACASHDGADDHQIQAARLLAEAGLDESALQCPAAIPKDPATAWSQRWPYPLAHNCSGKHASFLLATKLEGDDPRGYLWVDSPLQQRIKAHVEQACGATAHGPGIDGCGAPAWLLPLQSLATGFARLAGGVTPGLARIRAAMTGHPELIGGPGSFDTDLMTADGSVVAKRGAEAVFGAGVMRGDASLGVAVKISDGGHRADGPVAAALLEALGCTVPDTLRRPPVLGGGVPHGVLDVAPQAVELLAVH